MGNTLLLSQGDHNGNMTVCISEVIVNRGSTVFCLFCGLRRFESMSKVKFQDVWLENEKYSA